MQDIFSAEQLKAATVKKVDNPNSSLLLNQGNLKFELRALPLEVQFSPVFGIETLDYNHDGHLDILLAGNFFDVLPEMGQYNANYGLLLEGNGKGEFEVKKPKDTGFFTKGQVRQMARLRGANGQDYLVLAKNNDKMQVFGIKKNGGMISGL